ncbi:MAG TPA: DNA repair protein RadC [Vitreimonas sp.]|uniref:RadC family protein n=1 Tax=Vitreimonas sp. TaxID=3069702 RepID=UPI002D51ED9C|nr:DNA repair protein RadC [Vitreimonas sp.]HYD86165.1 DNA repair protein RadC [Vitreimonas sp.]
MAGRSGKQSDRPAPRVEDSELFPFALDGIEIDPPAQRRAKTKAPAAPKAKPHYHEHRQRLRQRFDEAGPAALQDYELLELFLFRVIPRQDTKPLAKALINRFGTLDAALSAPVHLIAEVDGAGAAVAQELKIAQALRERAAISELKQRTAISSWSQLVSYCRMALAHEPREQFRVLFLDSKNQLIRDEPQNFGTVDHAPVYPREVARRALELSAASMILVHNHPSGDPKPSAADIAVTRDIVAAASAVGVKVHDHLVIGRNGVESFKTLGLL